MSPVCKMAEIESDKESERLEVWRSLPVNAQSAQTEHRDANGGFLDEGHQLAQGHSKRPVLGQELQKHTDN